MSPEFAIIEERKTHEHTVVTIDTSKAKWQRIPWRELGDFGKRKFENFLVLSRTKERIKLIYA